MEKLKSKNLDKKNIGNIMELTSMQEGMLFHYLKDPGKNHYFEQLSLNISGAIDIQAFEQTWGFVIKTNEMLRTVFRWENIKKPVQVVLKESDFKPIYYDFSRENIDKKKTQLEKIKIKDRANKFDLKEVPFRVTLCKIAEDQYEMIVSNHHILYDGWSNGIILHEFFTTYEESSRSKQPVQIVKHQFKEFLNWLRSRDSQQQEKYWQEYLPGDDNQGTLSIKKAKIESDETTNPGILQSVFSRALKDQLEKFARQNKITLVSFFYCAWGLLLQKYNNTREVIFGTTVSGRTPEVKGIEDIVGLFINTIPLHLQCNPKENIQSLLSRLQLILQERKAYEHTPLVEIKKYLDLAHGKELFDSIVVIENYPVNIDLLKKNSNLRILSYSMFETTHYDLSVHFMIGADYIEVKFVYNRGLFPGEIVERLSCHFYRLVETMLHEPGQELGETDILSEEEREQVLHEFNDTRSSYPQDKTLPELFVQQVEQNPNKVAALGMIQGVGTRLIASHPRKRYMHITYDELNRKSNQLAHLLKEKGVHPDTIVAIMVERSLEMIIGMLSILKAGGAYLPIDPKYPEERITYMLKDSGSEILLKDNHFTPEAFNICPKGASIPPSTLLPFYPSSPSNLAYIIYTSGSTGKPKGVAVEQYSVVNLLYYLFARYPLSKTGAYLLKTPFIFDVSVSELFGWIPGGSRVVILEENAHKDPEKILQAIEYSRITHVNFVPSMFSVFVDWLNHRNIAKLSALKYIFLAGEALLPRHVNKFRRLNTAIMLENLYGPTEATVYSSKYSLSEKEFSEPIPIGKPIDNIRLYILDKSFHVQPPGIAGELFIAGVGLARGYLNRPGLTSEKFCLRPPGGSFCKNCPLDRETSAKNFLLKYIGKNLWQSGNNASMQYNSHSPYSPYSPYSPIYQTDDLARLQPDGNIEFLGRIDQQVKIRGCRIELGEIENQLRTHPQVKETVVTAREDRKGDKYLAAYIVVHNAKIGTASAAGMENLREFLYQTLPEYMIPSYFMQLEALPLTPGGKVDWKVLPEPGIKKGEEYVAPRNPIEQKLAKIWCEVLGRDASHASQMYESISINDNFFKLGGHSLKATILVTRISRVFNVEFPLGRIFTHPTIKSLAQLINKAGKSIYKAIIPVEKKEYYPLSSAQKRLFFLNRSGNTGTSYNMPAAAKIRVSPGKKRLVNVIETLIERHESLRTSFEFIDNFPVQRVHHEVEFEIEYYRAERKAQRAERKEERHAPCAVRCASTIKNFIRPFDLSCAPLIRAGLMEISNREYLLFFDMHHIISDGTSAAILMEEFTKLYTGENLPPHRIQYKDFCQWQENLLDTGKIKSQENYWLSLYAGEISGLNLPIDYPRPHVMSFEGDNYEFKLGPGDTLKFNVLASAHDVTLFMNLMAVFTVLLYKYTGQDDIIVGNGMAGRSHADLQTIIGMFVNVLPIRHHPDGAKTYCQFLAEVKESGIKAYENQDFPFEELVDKLKPKRDPSRNPLFDVCLMVQNFESPTGKPGIFTGFKENFPHGVSRFDLTLFAMERREEILLQLEYSTKLFKPETLRRLANHFLNIIRQVNLNPGIGLSHIDILTTAEKHRLLYDFNDTATLYPRHKTIHQLFAEQAQQTPDHTALLGKIPDKEVFFGQVLNACREGHLTYQELNEKSSQLAHLLMKKSVKPDTIVGIMVERSLEMVIGILGILKSGGAYLPIDPAHPQNRIKYMLEDSKVRVLVTTAKLQVKVKAEVEKNFTQPLQLPLHFVNIETGLISVFESSPSTLTCQVSPANLAYTLYTSGSIGRPKGVPVEHGSLINVLYALNRYYPFDESCIYLLKTSYEFDVSAAELFGWFPGGGTLAILEPHGEKDPQQLIGAIAMFGITHINFVPSMFRAFIDSLDKKTLSNYHV